MQIIKLGTTDAIIKTHISYLISRSFASLRMTAKRLQPVASYLTPNSGASGAIIKLMAQS